MVKVLLFGATADAVGSRQLDFRIEDAAMTDAVVERLKRDHPPLSGLRLLTAVNEEYADANTILRDGDEVAVFTAVSGG
jgi:molybdopterin converting factor small subunit